MLIPRRSVRGADNAVAVGWVNERISSELPAAAMAQSKRSSKRGCPGDRPMILRPHLAGPGATGYTRAGERALEFAVGGSEKVVRFHCGEQQQWWVLPRRRDSSGPLEPFGRDRVKRSASYLKRKPIPCNNTGDQMIHGAPLYCNQGNKIKHTPYARLRRCFGNIFFSIRKVITKLNSQE